MGFRWTRSADTYNLASLIKGRLISEAPAVNDIPFSFIPHARRLPKWLKGDRSKLDWDFFRLSISHD